MPAGANHTIALEACTVAKTSKLPLRRVMRNSSKGANVLDVGCIGFKTLRHAEAVERPDLKHYGVDYGVPENLPDGYTFKRCDLDLEEIPFSADTFDLTIASHVIEHLRDPIRFFIDLVRVTKPGGTVYIEAPSERSLKLNGMPFGYDDFRTVSFYDDPTHLGRPWTPQALYRLGCCCSCVPQDVGYCGSPWGRVKAPLKIALAHLFKRPDWYESGTWELVRWPSYAVISKPLRLTGKPEFYYAYRATK
jgi:SAM-dependent methyltransferase